MNAIILAAGMGTRLRPLTDSRPKALVEIAGESFFSRQLRQLREAGIRDIIVVTGYLAEAFSPWFREEGLRFIHNEHYGDRNNLWSMYLARRFLGDTVVLDGDLRLADGVIPRTPPVRSTWFVGRREDMRNEWKVVTDEDGRVHAVEVASGSGWILTGLSFWTGGDGELLRTLIAEAAEAEGTGNLFWDDVPRMNLASIDVRARRMRDEDWAEIDTLADRDALEVRLRRESGSIGPGDRH